MSKSPASLWRALEEFPPYFVRLLAKRSAPGWVALTDTDIAIASGITLLRVREISAMESWHDCTVREIHNFTLACGIDPANPRHRAKVRQYQFVCRKRGSRPFQWLKKSPKYESELLPLLQLLKARLGPQPSTSPTLVTAN